MDITDHRDPKMTKREERKHTQQHDGSLATTGEEKKIAKKKIKRNGKKTMQFFFKLHICN